MTLTMNLPNALIAERFSGKAPITIQ